MPATTTAPIRQQTFNLSSTMQMVSPEQLKAAEVQATLKPSLVIETFEDDWREGVVYLQARGLGSQDTQNL